MTYDQSVLNDYSVLSDPNDTLHRQVQTIVSSYNSAWDVLTELIQNSVDAVNMRGSRESPASGFQGIIYIHVNIENGTGSVSCNSVFVLHLCRFLNPEEFMKRKAMVQNP